MGGAAVAKYNALRKKLWANLEPDVMAAVLAARDKTDPIASQAFYKRRSRAKKTGVKVIDFEKSEIKRARELLVTTPKGLLPTAKPAKMKAETANDMFVRIGKATDCLFPDRVPGDRILEVAELQQHMLDVMTR